MTQAGEASGNTIQVPTTAYPTIQSGYNAAVTENTIEVQQGSYPENDDFNNSISVALIGGYDSSFSTNSAYSIISGTLTISKGTVNVWDIIIEPTGTLSSSSGLCSSVPAKPWPSISSGSISYITGTSCPVGSTLECSQQIANGSSCFYQSCECFFNQTGVGDTDSGYWQTFDASGNSTGIFDCEINGGLTALQIMEGSCSLSSNSLAQAFINSCATPASASITVTSATVTQTSSCYGGCNFCDLTISIAGTACGPAGSVVEGITTCGSWQVAGSSCTSQASGNSCTNWSYSLLYSQSYEISGFPDTFTFYLGMLSGSTISTSSTVTLLPCTCTPQCQ